MKYSQILFALGFLVVYGFGLNAQTLPKNMSYSEDQHRLTLAGAESKGFYDLAKIEKVYLDFYPTNFWTMLHLNYDTENNILAKFTYMDVVFDTVGVQFKGQTSYKKAKQQREDKLPFSVKLDHFVDGQDIEGYNNFNFNNSWGDFSCMREVLYTQLAKRHVPAAQSNYVRLYINGEDWGLYPNIQQINKDYLKEWFLTNDGIRWRAKDPDGTGAGSPGSRPQWGDGTKALNYLGADSTEYISNYMLKASDVAYPWEYLIHVCDMLNNTPIDDLYAEVREVLDVDGTLWFLATENVFSDDDSYIHKGEMDYQLYWDMETSLFTPLEMDGNSVLGNKNLEWGAFMNEKNENYPLLDRLLEIPELRQRYLAHMRTILADSFEPDMVNAKITSLYSLINQNIMSDPKKFFSYNQFRTTVNQLRTNVITRYNNLMNDSEVKEKSPAIAETRMEVSGQDWGQVSQNEEVEIQTRAGHVDGLKQVFLYYATGYYGNFQKIEMENVGTSLYKGVLPGFAAGSAVRFYIEAVANNEAKSRRYDPQGAEHDVYMFHVSAGEVAETGIVINEIMAANDETLADEFSEYDDWIELYNNSDTEQSLQGWALTDNSSKLFKWTFPADAVIPAHDYLLVWADDDEDQSPLHASFKLSADGEEVYLVTPDGLLADEVIFTAQNSDIAYARVPNGTGSFSQVSPTPGSMNTSSSKGDELEGFTKGFFVYPNPAETHIRLSILDWQNYKVSLTNMLGQNQFCKIEGDQINISNLKSGYYLISLTNGSKPVLFLKK